MESDESPYTIIDNRLAQYLILTGYHLYQGHNLDSIPTESLLNLKELLDLELTYRQGDFH
mgnify:FL=1